MKEGAVEVEEMITALDVEKLATWHEIVTPRKMVKLIILFCDTPCITIFICSVLQLLQGRTYGQRLSRTTP
jgi:hypothetical protein